MDIFTNQRDIANPDVVLFTRLIHSTSSVESYLENVQFNEEDLIDILYATEEIVSIDCNFGHIRWPGYDPNPNKNKSNKGRKAQEKPKKKRKVQGDGSSFNSSIQFTIIGSCVRQKSDVPDTRSVDDYVSVEDVEEDHEKIVKYYKIKLYRNGRSSVPGSLIEDLSDAVGPLEILCRYLFDVFNLPVRRTYLKDTMKNYKFRLKDFNIDMRALQNYFASQYEKVKLVRFEDIKKFLISPAFEDHDANPSEGGWVKFIKNLQQEVENIRSEYLDIEINYDAMEFFLRQSYKSKNMFVLIDDLQAEIERYNPVKVYKKMIDFIIMTKKRYGYELGDKIIKKTLDMHMTSYFASLQKKLSASKNNDISGFRYNPERTQVFIIRIKPMKKTQNPHSKKAANESNITIKLYPKGKINIDNAKSREEAEYVYYWLNDLFISNEELIFDPNIHLDDLDPDDEWSYTDSEDASDEDEDEE